MPMAKSYVKFRLQDGAWQNAKILSRQPKRTGINKDWMNVHIEGEDDPCSVNWQQVTAWVSDESEEVVLFLTADQELCQDVVNAKEKELDNLDENEVYELVPDDGQFTISTKWIITEKMKAGEVITKARLVARGFEENTEELRTDSPTCSKQSLRMVFATTATMKWTLHSLDITSAFLQGYQIDRDVYLKPPFDVEEPGFIWKLKRCIYGLNDAPRAWYQRVLSEFTNLGAKQSTFDHALFMWHKNGALEGILVAHVDDFVFSGTDQWQKSVMDVLRSKFKISAEAERSFKYIGIDVDQHGDVIKINQEDYIQSLEPIPILRGRAQEKDDILDKSEKRALKSLCGKLQWVTTNTRVDMAYDTCVTSNVGKYPLVRNIIEANKTIRKMKRNKVALTFPDLGNPEDVKVLCYGDATHASLPTGASQGAYLVFIVGNSRAALLSWSSKKLHRVTKSPLASETLSLGEAADAGYLIASMWQEVFGLISLPEIQCVTDNKSLDEMLKTTNVITDMRLRVDVARLREMTNLKEISVNWTEGKNQLADTLTKKGASSDKLLTTLENAQLPA